MMRRMSAAAVAALMVLVAGPGLAQSRSAAAAPETPAPVEYELRFDNAVHHEARITVTHRGLEPGPVRFQMSRSSPGRYAIHEFAKNVYSVAAADSAGRPLTVRRTDPYGWTVEGHDGVVTVSYTLYADRGDGTYAQIDATHAHLNMPAVLMWASGHDDRPARLRFHRLTPDWRIATQLAPTQDPEVFTAPNLQYLMDSPVEISAHVVREWQVDDAGTPRTIRIALHHAGTDAEADEFAARARRVIDAQIAVFGDVPDFDHGTYTFLADYLPHISGDGMEHRNSTVISTTRGLAEADYGQIGTLSHEFFHAWNVERIRPAELEPFDYSRANATPSLWLAEGFTNYYGPLTIRRAGLSDVDRFLAEMGGQLNFVLNSPARAYGSPQEMSLRAPFVDAAASIDPTNPNIFVSYYTYGAALGLTLDLTLRQKFPGVTLDDYMRQLWRVHGLTETPYTPDDLRAALAAVTGDEAFAADVFARSINDSQLPEFGPLLAQAGLVLKPARPDRAWAGPVRLEASDQTARLATATQPGTPLYEGGADRGDEIVSLGAVQIDSQADWDRALDSARPGDEMVLRFIQRGREVTTRIRMAADPAMTLARVEADGGEVTPDQLAFRNAWLGEEVAAAGN
ncbi:M61 family metallopeptidase [Brevundimonas sp.]|uniref:M61 family metallopeptidase n=1 Tax=Brevundimonas sp. TaxID=1871086 RepID=UPI0025BDD7B3|nr:M61 family peptidase [Brevundimonas sp.]